MWKCRYRWSPLSDLQPALAPPPPEPRLTKACFLASLLAAHRQYPLIKPVTLSLTVTLKKRTKVTLRSENRDAHQRCLSVFFELSPFFRATHVAALFYFMCRYCMQPSNESRALFSGVHGQRSWKSLDSFSKAHISELFCTKTRAGHQLGSLSEMQHIKGASWVCLVDLHSVSMEEPPLARGRRWWDTRRPLFYCSYCPQCFAKHYFYAPTWNEPHHMNQPLLSNYATWTSNYASKSFKV